MDTLSLKGEKLSADKEASDTFVISFSGFFEDQQSVMRQFGCH